MRGPAAAPDWLAARPVAHRGLHDVARGRIENSLSAARAAVEAGYPIECDVRLARDGDAVVFHDATLDRLTGETGAVADRPTAALRTVPYAAGPDRIATLSDLLALIRSRVPLVCEVKSRFDGDVRLADRVAALLRAYPGPVAIKSFDPAVVAHLRPDPPGPLGMVAEARYDDPEWADLPAALRTELGQFLHFERTRPDFLSYRAVDLPHAVPLLLRRGLGVPVLAWTVRSPAGRAAALPWADQIVFEGFLPDG